PFKSVLSILNQEEDIAPAYQSFRSIIFSDFSKTAGFERARELFEFNKMLKAKSELEQIQESSVGSRFKLALAYYCVPEVFIRIKERFIDIFPQVEDVSFELLKAPDLFPGVSYDYPSLRIKEKGVERWIPQERISSGMYKTFMHISEMFLWPEGTVILIDEFENSLGVNCIDVLTEDLIQNRLQFIITSHHPYIINNINPRYWKIVTRTGGVVTTHDASELEISSSKHQAFIQLINKEEFKEGIGV
ncbi:MAG: AAA family ATPase, partial [Acidobacteriota bacterium]